MDGVLTLPVKLMIFYGDEMGMMGVLEEEYRCSTPWESGNNHVITTSSDTTGVINTETYNFLFDGKNVKSVI